MKSQVSSILQCCTKRAKPWRFLAHRCSADPILPSSIPLTIQIIWSSRPVPTSPTNIRVCASHAECGQLINHGAALRWSHRYKMFSSGRFFCVILESLLFRIPGIANQDDENQTCSTFHSCFIYYFIIS